MIVILNVCEESRQMFSGILRCAQNDKLFML